MNIFEFTYPEKTYQARYEIIYGKGDPFCIVRMNDKGLPYPFEDVLTMTYEPTTDIFSWGNQESKERADLLTAIAKGVKETMSKAKGGHPW